DDRGAGLALLHRREARPTVPVERADLAVQHAVRRLHRLRQLLRDGGEPCGQVVSVSTEELHLAAAQVRERPVAVPLDLEQPRIALRHVLVGRGEHHLVAAPQPPVAPSAGSLLALPDDEPVLRVAVELRRNQRPQALEPGSLAPNGQPAVLLLLDELVGAAVPDLDRARAVLTFRDLALEARVVEGMVLDVNGEGPLPRLERYALRHRPARERTVTLEAEVVVEPPGVAALA